MLTPDDLEGLADSLGSQDAVFMWLGVIPGLRWGEAAGLRAGAIDIRRRTVTVSQQLGRDRTWHAPKSDAGRRVLAGPMWPIDELVAILVARTGDHNAPEQLVFQTTVGTTLQYNNSRYRTWIPATTAAGLPGLR